MDLRNVKLLDVGCDRKPYHIYFTDSQLYIGVDKNPEVADVDAVAEALPFRDMYFDVVLCTQVLEHEKYQFFMAKCQKYFYEKYWQE